MTNSAITSSSLRLAARLDTVGFSDIVQIRNKVMELKAAGRSVYEFQGGEPYMPTPEPIKKAMRQALVENKTRYAPSSGVMELRQAILRKVTEKNRIPAKIDDVIVVNGGMQGLFAAFQTVLDSGDECLLFSPFWTPIKDLIGYSQARPVYVPMKVARTEGITAALEQYTTAKTRVIYFNTPQNPSGEVFTRKDAEAVAKFARERDLLIIADEAYEDLIYDGEHVSIASLEGMAERTMTCFTMSKSYAMTGWRAGYVIASEPWMTGLRKTTLYSTNGVSTPTQWAAVAAMSLSESYFADCRTEYKKRRDLLCHGLSALGLNCPLPSGAFYAFADVTQIDANSRTAAAKLLEAAQVATVPGSVFGEAGEGHVRFSFSTAMETIEAGLESIKKKL